MATRIPTFWTLSPDREALVCSRACETLIEEHLILQKNPYSRDLRSDELEPLVGDAVLLVTSWGSPPITEAVLDRASHLRVVAHAAGSVKYLVPPSIFDRGIVVISGASRIAQTVAEYCVAGALHWLGRLPANDSGLRLTGWRTEGLERHELRAMRVGVVSASMTGQRFIELMHAFGAQVLLYDPVIADSEFDRLGVQRASLDEVMACPVISIHAPALPATRHLIDSRRLTQIQDGAIFINSSRGAVVDEAALTDQLATGRFFAVLDVFQQEPLASDHRLRTLPNVVLTPHVAGHSWESDHSLMEFVLQDALACLKGNPAPHAVDGNRWDYLA